MVFDIRTALATALADGNDGGALFWNGHWLSGRWLRGVSEALGLALAEVGSDHTAIGLIARNRPGSVAALVSQVAAGRTTVMIHSAQSATAIAVDLVRAGVATVVAESGDWTAQALAAVRSEGIAAIALDADGVPRVVAAGRGATIIPRAGDIGIELLSSGTTGPPKRVPLAWSTLSSAACDARGAYAGTGTAAGERTAPQILLHPLGNIAGVAYVLPALAFGQPIVLLERFTVADWVAAVRLHRPRRAALPPAALGMLLDSDTPTVALATLEIVAVGGGRLDLTVQDRFEARFGVPVLTAFGATEFAGVIANWSLDLYRRYGREKRGSAGRASANVRLRIVDPLNHAPLSSGTVGLLEAQVARLGDGWVRTTDLAAIDADGFLFVHGRADGAINRGGFKIVPETVVDALLAHPAVADAAVVARSDARLGEVPVAAVELRRDMLATGAELRDWAKARLLAYQVPVEIRVLDRLPRTGSMKVALGEVAALLNG